MSKSQIELCHLRSPYEQVKHPLSLVANRMVWQLCIKLMNTENPKIMNNF